MTIQINGTSGISGVDGSAGTPALQGSDTNTGISFGTDTVNINTGGTTRATVDSSGRMLVGTSSARNKFFNTSQDSLFQVEGVSGGSQVISHTYGEAGNGGPYLVFTKNRSGTIGGTTVVNDGDQIGAVSFQGSDGSEAVEAARIQAFVDGAPGANDMPGRLVFSTTADVASSPTERLRISSDGRWTTYSTASTAYTFATSKAAGTTDILIQGEYNSTGVGSGSTSFRVLSNGNVQNTNNSYGAISDIKLKENIVDASSQWDDLKAIQVRNYNFKEGQTHTQIGLIAQEVEPISPGLVYESPDRDEDGNDLGTVTKSVNYSVLYMKAVKALQEAMERIESLETRLTALEVGTNQ